MKIHIYIVLVGMLGLAWACKRKTGDYQRIPIEDFFEKPDKSSFKLSPDGKRIAYIGLDEHCRNIFILDLEHTDSSKQLTYQDQMNVQYFFWATNDTLVYSNSQSSDDRIRLYTIDIHTEASSPLMEPVDTKLRWVHPAKAIDGHLHVMMNLRDSSVFDLYRIPLDGSGPQFMEQNSEGFMSWYASFDGKVRMAMSSDSVQETLWYREEEDQEYHNVLQTDSSSKIIHLGPVKNKKDQIYALSNLGRDKLALVTLDLNTGREAEILYADPNNDINWEGYSSGRKSVLYSSIYNEKKNTLIHDKELAKIYERIRERFRDYTLDIIDVDSLFNTVIFKPYTDTNPGSIYYYYRQKDTIVELSPQNPLLADKTLSPMKQVTFNARDGKLIHGFLTYPHKKTAEYPVVVLVHDGPNRRDVWGFNAEVQFLANRGYLVFQINYRGSVGFGKEFYTAGFKQWGGKIQSDINDGVTWLINEGIADPKRVAIMGTGFGGYSALYASCFSPTLYTCAISSSGYTNLFTYFKEIPPYYQSYTRLYHRIIGNPHKESDLFKAISPLFHAEKIRTPLLIFQGGKDRYNSTTDVNQFVQRVKNNNVPVRYIYNKEEGKRIRKEENIIAYYQEIEQFLETYLK
ncbi:S9 family peptidase [Sphingobacterium sp. SGG-5]|uniref:S9 family peptidase n=1 Tax=Sphingobacterium sp. SGG-5 TaxID=2710881 RepID=UPI0013EC6CA6|nr:prolyl oligopeptidase family serine peptidase [Sphingobacterium sp. SGG-5]NGM62917.1 S9 family peptidase [Sphingobacterium sp. SGG-5]